MPYLNPYNVREVNNVIYDQFLVGVLLQIVSHVIGASINRATSL